MPDHENNASQQAKRKNSELSPEKEASLVGSMKVTDLMSVITEAINNSLDEKRKNLATKTDIEEIKKEIGEVNSEMEVLKYENKQLQQEVEKLKREKEVEMKSLFWLNQQTGNKKLIFKGIKTDINPLKAIKRI